ncbi:glutamyl-tRNA reductase [soil metagenome]
MSLVCLGLNHKTAPVEIRERLAFGEKEIPSAIAEMTGRGIFDEVVVLSTCNRVEIYGASGQHDEPSLLAGVRSFLTDHFRLGAAAAHCFYGREGPEAIRHLLRVSSGLDSMMVGETEIFGQVKRAYQIAHGAGGTNKTLNKLFQQAFQIGKLVRTSTQITQGATSVGAAAVDLAGKIFGDLKKCRVMVLGAGEMSRRTAMSLQSRGAGSIIVSNRSYDRAVDLASEMGGRALRFDDWESEIGSVDIMITSTSAPHHVITAQHAREAMRHRRGQPLFIIDIAVPRDVDPAVESIDGVYLYDIDALEAIASDGRRQRQAQIAACDRLIDDHLAEIIRASRSVPTAPPPARTHPTRLQPGGEPLADYPCP